MKMIVAKSVNPFQYGESQLRVLIYHFFWICTIFVVSHLQGRDFKSLELGPSPCAETALCFHSHPLAVWMEGLCTQPINISNFKHNNCIISQHRRCLQSFCNHQHSAQVVTILAQYSTTYNHSSLKKKWIFNNAKECYTHKQENSLRDFCAWNIFKIVLWWVVALLYSLVT